MTQTQLAKALGITFQQVQKYENGTNQVSVTRLLRLCRALDVPVAYFVDGIEQTETGNAPPTLPPKLVRRKGEMARGTLELVRMYLSIRSETTRKRVRDLVRAVARELS